MRYIALSEIYLVKINFGSFIFVCNVATRTFLMMCMIVIALLDSTMGDIHGGGSQKCAVCLVITSSPLLLALASWT